MARIRLVKGKTYKFVPLSERVTEKPFYVEIIPMSHAEYMDYVSDLAFQWEGTNDREERGDISRQQDKKMFTDHVKGFGNLLKEDGKKDECTAGEFYETEDHVMIDEIQKAIKSNSELTAGQLKNFAGG